VDARVRQGSARPVLESQGHRASNNCASRALPSGIMSEQVHPYTGEPLSVSPLTWSHAAFVSAVQHYARRSRLIKDRLRDQVKTAGEVIV